MTNDIDDLFKKPLAGTKRKLESVQDPDSVYKAAKLSAAQEHIAPQVEDEDEDVEAGPELPEDEEGRFFGGGITDSTAEVLNYIDEKDDDVAKIDISWLRKASVTFEKRITKNAELRAKFEDTPAKFMASEADLDSSIKELSLLSDHSELFSEFVRLGCAKSLVDLLAHENTDIAIDTLEVIAEFMDEDVAEGWDTLVDALLDADLLNLVNQDLRRFDETIESDRNGVYHALNLVENLASRTSLSEKLVDTFAPWLLQRIQGQEGQNQQYAMEIMAILSQSSRRLAELDAEDLLLQILYTRKGDTEFLENVWDCLASIAGPKFIDAEGVELCLKLLKEGNKRSLVLLNSAPGVSQRIVEAAGLKILFGHFMKKQDFTSREYESFLGIFLNMMQELPKDSASRIRLTAKFVEKDYQKVMRLVELRPARDDTPISEATDFLLELLAKEDSGIRQRLETEE